MNKKNTTPEISIIAFVKILRPKQWIKNSFVFAPLIFSGLFLSQTPIKNSIIAAVLFCIASSAVYILNDILDIELDRQHPTKSVTRPLASGAISVSTAITILIILYSTLGLAWFWLPETLNVIFIYILLNWAYAFYLKHKPILDIFTIASGFVLRVLAGSVAINVKLSSWMFITTLCIALYLAAIKRRQELIKNGSNARKVLGQYTPTLANRYAETSATCALFFYSMYVMNDRPELVMTIPIVLFGFFRYWYLTEALSGGESPTDSFLKDIPLILTVSIWIFACVFFLWPI